MDAKLKGLRGGTNVRRAAFVLVIAFALLVGLLLGVLTRMPREDINRDGRVNVLDVQLVINTILKP